MCTLTAPPRFVESLLFFLLFDRFQNCRDRLARLQEFFRFAATRWQRAARLPGARRRQSGAALRSRDGQSRPTLSRRARAFLRPRPAILDENRDFFAGFVGSKLQPCRNSEPLFTRLKITKSTARTSPGGATGTLNFHPAASVFQSLVPASKSSAFQPCFKSRHLIRAICRRRSSSAMRLAAFRQAE